MWLPGAGPRNVCAIRTVDPLRPTETAALDGLAYTLWQPAGAGAGIVVVHGADSAKESHHDFARAASALGLACVCFDQRGHGDSDGRLDGRAIDDVAAMAELLRARLRSDRADPSDPSDPSAPSAPGPEDPPIALRGSSMGGYLAVVAARAARAAAVVAICPASANGLRRGLQGGRFGFAADSEGLLALLEAHDLGEAVAGLGVPLLIMHAEGDEQVPVEHSRELAGRFATPGCRLLTVPGGHHRSIQHDEELQAFSLRWIARAVGVG